MLMDFQIVFSRRHLNSEAVFAAVWTFLISVINYFRLWSSLRKQFVWDFCNWLLPSGFLFSLIEMIVMSPLKNGDKHKNDFRFHFSSHVTEKKPFNRFGDLEKPQKLNGGRISGSSHRTSRWFFTRSFLF